MTEDNKATQTAQRRHWISVLARATKPELEEALVPMAPLLPIQYLRPAEAGMMMLRGRVGGTGDAFNLGEASVTRCALRVGTSALGVGYTLGRDRRKAELIAVLDALLQDEARQAGILEAVIAPLAQKQALQRDAVSRNVATSKVEFFTFVRGAT